MQEKGTSPLIKQNVWDLFTVNILKWPHVFDLLFSITHWVVSLGCRSISGWMIAIWTKATLSNITIKQINSSTWNQPHFFVLERQHYNHIDHIVTLVAHQRLCRRKREFDKVCHAALFVAIRLYSMNDIMNRDLQNYSLS